MLKFRCGNCKQKMGVPEEYAGKRVRCPRCKQAVRVPQATELPAEEQPAAPEAVGGAPPAAPDLASVFAQYMPTGVDPVHASMDDLWEERIPAGADSPDATAAPVEHSEPVDLSQTMEVVPAAVTAEVMEPSPARPSRVVRSSNEEVNDLLRDLGEPQPPAEEPPPYSDDLDESPPETAPPEPNQPAAPIAESEPASGAGASLLGMAGILLGVGAVALCCFTGHGKFAVPIGAAGLVMALAGAAVTAARNAPGVLLSGAGTIVCAIGIAVPVLGAYGVMPLPGRVRVSRPESTPVANISMASDAFAIPAAQHIPVDGYIAATSSVVVGEVQVGISSVRIVQPVVHDGHWNSIHSLPDKRLLISLELKNVATSGHVAYRTWSQPTEGVKLTDGAGNALKQVDTGSLVPFGRVSEDPAMLYAGRSAVPDVLIFERPADPSHDLKLELPCANIGQPATTLRIRIPAGMIQH